LPRHPCRLRSDSPAARTVRMVVAYTLPQTQVHTPPIFSNFATNAFGRSPIAASGMVDRQNQSDLELPHHDHIPVPVDRDATGQVTQRGTERVTPLMKLRLAGKPSNNTAPRTIIQVNSRRCSRPPKCHNRLMISPFIRQATRSPSGPRLPCGSVLIANLPCCVLHTKQLASIDTPRSKHGHGPTITSGIARSRDKHRAWNIDDGAHVFTHHIWRGNAERDADWSHSRSTERIESTAWRRQRPSGSPGDNSTCHKDTPRTTILTALNKNQTPAPRNSLGRDDSQAERSNRRKRRRIEALAAQRGVELPRPLPNRVPA